MNWFNILKESRQISDTGITFTLPEEETEDDRDCCQEAKNAYKILSFGSIEEYDSLFRISETGGYAGTTGCSLFKDYLFKLIKAHTYRNDEKLKSQFLEILDNWEECENE